jgi:hypothetical protein
MERYLGASRLAILESLREQFSAKTDGSANGKKSE